MTKFKPIDVNVPKIKPDWVNDKPYCPDCKNRIDDYHPLRCEYCFVRIDWNRMRG